jgi:ribosomal protein S21
MQVKKRKNETFDALFRRFNQRLRSSGLLLEVRSRRHYKKPITKNKRRASKLRSLRVREKRTYLEKVGLLPNEPHAQRRSW